MPDVRALTMIEFALDDLYEQRHHPGKQEILKAVRATDPPPEYVDYFERIPIGTYSRERLEEMLNDTVAADGKTAQIGHLG
jgi:hypothetical protein